MIDERQPYPQDDPDLPAPGWATETVANLIGAALLIAVICATRGIFVYWSAIP